MATTMAVMAPVDSPPPPPLIVVLSPNELRQAAQRLLRPVLAAVTCQMDKLLPREGHSASSICSLNMQYVSPEVRAMGQRKQLSIGRRGFFRLRLTSEAGQ